LIWNRNETWEIIMKEVVESGLNPSVQNISDRLRSLRTGPQAGKGQDEAKLRKVCQDFEAVFIGQIWKQMRSSVPKDGMLHSKEEESYLSMFDQELSVKMARSGGIGLSDMLYSTLSERLLNASKNTNSSGTMNPLRMPSGRVASSVPEQGARSVAAAAAQREAELLAQRIERAHNPNPVEPKVTTADLEDALRMVRMDSGEDG
jgi:flagellar protein FlgJ